MAQKLRWPSPPLLLTWALATIWAAALAWLAIHKHQTLHSTSFDLAIFDQIVWNTANGDPFAVSFQHQGNHFAQHVSPILAAFAPLYWAWQDVRMLLIVQAMILASGALAMYVLAAKRLGSPYAGVLMAATYLLYPSFAWLALFDFHQEVLLAPLIPLAFYLIWRGHYRWLAATCAAMLLIKEDAAVVVFGLGLYLAVVRRQAGPGLGLAAVGGGWFLLATQVLIPYLRGGEPYPFAGRYASLGASPLDIAVRGLTEPRLLLSVVSQNNVPQYLINLLAPLALLPIFSPGVLLAALPAFFGNALSDYEGQRSLGHQYALPLAPVVVVAAVDAVGNLRDWLARRAARANKKPIRPLELDLAALILAFAVLVNVRDNAVVRHWAEGNLSEPPQLQAFLAAKAQIPTEASLAASNTLGPQFSHRRFLIHFPPGGDPSGLPESSRDLRLFDAHDPEFVIVDTNWDRVAPAGMTPLRDATEEAMATWGYQRIVDQEGIVLLRRALVQGPEQGSARPGP